MAKCAINGTHMTINNHRTFSNKAVKRTYSPNLQRRRMMIDGKMQTVMVSVKALRTLAKVR